MRDWSVVLSSGLATGMVEAAIGDSVTSTWRGSCLLVVLGRSTLCGVSSRGGVCRL